MLVILPPSPHNGHFSGSRNFPSPTDDDGTRLLGSIADPSSATGGTNSNHSHVTPTYVSIAVTRRRWHNPFMC